MHSLDGDAYLFVLNIGTELDLVFNVSKWPNKYLCMCCQTHFNILIKQMYKIIKFTQTVYSINK